MAEITLTLPDGSSAEALLGASRALVRSTMAEYLRDRSSFRGEEGLARMVMSKYVATNNAIRAVDYCMEAVGAHGMLKKFPMERYYRDVRAGVNHPMSNARAREFIGKAGLGSPQGEAALERTATELRHLHGVSPAAVACDMHPDYGSTRFAERAGLPRVPVQHHVAHVMACMAEHGLAPPVLGVAWDGTGYGPDGTAWGGEFLLIEEGGWRRAGHLHRFRLPGGERAAREPRRAALGLLYELFGSDAFAMEFLPQQNKRNAGDTVPDPILATGKRVVIIGGGDTGADCLGTVHRQKPMSVRQFELLPMPPAERAPQTPWPLWPLKFRLSYAMEEATADGRGEQDFSVVTTELTGNGRVQQLHYAQAQPAPPFGPV